MLAFVVVTGLGVFFGARLLKLLPMGYVKKATSALFILFGVIFIASSLIGASIL